MTDSKTQHRGGAGNFAEDRERAAEAGHKGGQQSGGNFAHDRERGPGVRAARPAMAATVNHRAMALA
jgi:hypothetical protein